MTALWSFDDQPRTGDPLLPGAAPAAIRDALLPEDQAAFDTAYQDALGHARERLELTELFKTLEHWRRLALLQRDPDRFASVIRRAAERLSGEPVPVDEPLTQTRRRVGLQLDTVYRVTTDERSQPQIEALPDAAGAPFAEARVVLEVAPWSGDPLIGATPDGGVQTMTFGSSGEGMITHLILEDQRRVDILDVLWIG